MLDHAPTSAHGVLQPFEFIVGEPVGAVAGKRISEGANGLFSGQGGPEPPIVLSTAVVGMKDGGKVSTGLACSNEAGA